jgi:APA family basic amino acid/polyamine antiporter
MALAGAVTVAELATTFPRVGGDYVFVREGFGPTTGFVAGWATFFLGFVAPTAVIARLAGSYLIDPYETFLREQGLDFIAHYGPQSVAALIIICSSIAHVLGHRQSATFQTISTISKLLVLALLCLAGLFSSHAHWEYLQQSSWLPRDQWSLLATDLIYVCYAYSGWNGAGYLAGEIKNPTKLLPRSLIGGTVTVIVIYLALNLTYAIALDPQAMQQLPADKVENVAEMAMQQLFGTTAATVGAMLLGLGLIASVSAYMMIGPRVALAMANDGAFLPFAGYLHPTRQTPIAAIVLQGLLACVLVWSGSFLQLLDYVAVGLSAVSGLMIASIFPIRRRELDRPYRMPFYPLPPILYLGLVTWTIANTLMQPDRRVPALLSLATMALGVEFARRIKKVRPHQ